MQAVREILLARRPAWADNWIALQLDSEEPPWRLDSTLTWNDVRELMKAGVIGRPTVDGYTRLLAFQGHKQFDPSRDADVLESDIWRLFAVDNSASAAFRTKRTSIEDPRRRKARPRPASDGNSPDGRGGFTIWRSAESLTAAACSMRLWQALWRNVHARMRLGLMRFVAILEPTDDEMAARQSTYRELFATITGRWRGWLSMPSNG